MYMHKLMDVNVSSGGLYFMSAIKKKGKISRNEDNKTLCPRGAIGDKGGGAMGRGPPPSGIRSKCPPNSKKFGQQVPPLQCFEIETL